MAEKRKPTYIILLKKQGKKGSNKVELFDAKLFGYEQGWKQTNARYRLRVNGKWYGGKGTYFTKWEFRDILWRSFFK